MLSDGMMKEYTKEVIVMERDYCQCEHSSSVYTDDDEWGHWDVCSDCKKPIEDSYQQYNHYDGEDHDFDY